VIYDHPLDYPNGYVLRPQFIMLGNKEPVRSKLAWYAQTPDELRKMIPPGATLFADPNPYILEVWME